MNDTFTDTVIGFTKGNKGDFQIIYEKYVDKVYYGALAYTRNKTLAEDITQETFVILYEKRDTLRSPYAFQSWMYKIYLSVIRSFKTKLSRWILHGDTENILNELQEKHMPDISESIILDEAQNKLNDKQRLIILLFYIHGLKEREISELLSIPEGTVKSRLYNAKKNIRCYFKEEC